MEIILKSLTLLNFKGIRKLDVDFERENFVFGQNESGKTTLMDAYLWVLFGKDSAGRSDSKSEIKTLDSNNEPYHKLSHEVRAVLDINGEEIILKKVFREKWVKARGSATEEFSGHLKEFYWNDVPMKESEYEHAISGLINENLFKLLTDATYFNSLSWQERRSVLIELAGNIEDSRVLELITTVDNKDHIALLVKALNQKKTIEQFQKEIVSKKSLITSDLKHLPARIEEARFNLPDVIDSDVIETNIAKLRDQLENVEDLLMNKTKAQKDRQDHISSLLNQRQEIRTKIKSLEYDETNKVEDRKRQRDQNIKDKERQLNNLNDDLNRTRAQYKFEDAQLTQLEERKLALKDEYLLVSDQELKFDEKDFKCPTCKREFEAEKVDEKKNEFSKNFNADKSKRLADIAHNGNKLSEQIKDITAKLSNLKARGDNLKSEISVLEKAIAEYKSEHERLSDNDTQLQVKAIAENVNYQALIKEISDLNDRINEPTDEINNSALIEQKKSIQSELDKFNKEKGSIDTRKRMLDRIAELEGQESILSQELADLEAVEFCILKFTKTKMDEVENRVNGLFNLVKFKMFEVQINQGLNPTCVTLINGVPYPVANTAAKIQAGLDIINVLSAYYKINVPVWIDNRESITKLPDTSSQLISLVVSPKDKKLRIETAAKSELAPTLFG